MGNISTAVPQNLISRVVGYVLTRGQQQVVSVNLPQRIALLGPANNANQASLGGTPQPRQITSAQEAADLYGYGSPIHQQARILFPVTGGGLRGIPVFVYPQLEAGGATATSIDINVTGTPSRNVSHRLLINGRDNVDGELYEINLVTTDTEATIKTKINNAINAVTGSSVTSVVMDVSGTDKVRATTKYRSSISAELMVSIDTRGDSAGLTYVIDNKVDGAGTENIATALQQFGNEWNTIVTNPYGADKFDELETFNGTPSRTNPTGQYEGITFRPMVALWGSRESSRNTLVGITGAEVRRNQVTNVLCPAPNSGGNTWEAAANGALIVATISQSSPHLAYGAQSYNDMPVPADNIIGDMANYNDREVLAQNGASTVTLDNGRYTIQELITTYRPAGEIPPSYRYVRDMMVHWNIRYGYLLREAEVVRDKALSANETTVVVDNVIKPKEWIAELFDYADDLGGRALIANPAFMKESIQVGVGSSNPNRLETRFAYETTGTVKIASTTAEANFAFNL